MVLEMADTLHGPLQGSPGPLYCAPVLAFPQTDTFLPENTHTQQARTAGTAVLTGGSLRPQVAKVCNELRSIPELQGGFNAVGFSQGGQFLRVCHPRAFWVAGVA
jgi:hypothetical protein